MEYFLILVILFLVSLILEKKYHIHLYQSRRERFIIPLIFFVIGTAWDSFAVLRGHWFFNFNSDRLLGIKIGLLPLEEYMFFFIVPYFILTLYRILKIKI